MSQRRWMRGRLLAAALVVVALPLADGHPAAQQKERYTLSGSDVAIFNLAGELRVEPGTGSTVVVEVTRGGRDAGELRVATGPKAGLQTLRVIYPGHRIVYRRSGPGNNTSLEVAPDGTFGDDHGIGWLLGARRVTVSGSGSGTEAWADLHVLVPKGQKIRLHHMVGDVNVGAVEGTLVLDSGAGTVEVKGVKGTLDIDTGSGAVRVADVEGEVSLDTGSGSVVVSGVRGGHLAMDTGSGGVRVSGVEVHRLSADTGSGGVELEDIQASEIVLDTGSGPIDIDLRSDIETLVVDSGSGGVTVTFPAKIGAEFDVETGSGSIEVDIPHEAFQIERDHVRGRIGDGHGRIKIDSGSGGVRLLRRSTSSERPGTILGALVVPVVG